MFWCFFRGTVGHRRRFERLSWRAVYMYNDFLFILRRKGAVMFWCCHGVPCNAGRELSWRAVCMYNDFLFILRRKVCMVG